ncbi:hypothetical protein GQ44DRAFT_629009 [Phaeosphaeriaceae sp. PMI808]|nr:hypothetical protein GQ44DRAFT_629009 [Phaeosphaeriaceae sp. PMI808]
MPPRIPITPSLHSHGYTWDIALCLRTFSSTPTTLALGPQSPNYIEVPKPLQPTFPLDPHVKGHLPVPRDIFRTRNKHPKESAVFLDRSTRLPKEVKAPGPYSRDVDYRLYKQRLADKRRAALQEGVKQLHDRKVTAEAQKTAELHASYAERRAKAMAPPRQVDVLTQTSISKGIRDFLASDLPVSSRSIITPARRKAYQQRIAKVQAVRSSRLHDLYVNAREFIVDEQQLDEAIEKTFGSEEAPVGWNVKGNMGLRSEGNEGLSIWHGPLPEGVNDMLQKLNGGEGVGLAKERVKKVAEALTGGKM